MKILAVDTATTVSSVAFLENGQLSVEATFPPNDSNGVTVSGKSNHSETVLPLIQSVLDRAHRRFSDVDAIAVGELKDGADLFGVLDEEDTAGELGNRGCAVEAVGDEVFLAAQDIFRAYNLFQVLPGKVGWRS